MQSTTSVVSLLLPVGDPAAAAATSQHAVPFSHPYTPFPLLQVRLSVVEIYCERIRDLLDPSRDNLQVKQDATGAIFIEGERAPKNTDTVLLIADSSCAELRCSRQRVHCSVRPNLALGRVSLTD